MTQLRHIQQTIATRSRRGGKGIVLLLMLCLSLNGCIREPELYLPDSADIDVLFPMVSLELEAYWDYELIYETEYHWRNEWFYEWDEDDIARFGPIGYSEPSLFNLRRYYTGDVAYGKHTGTTPEQSGKTYRGSFKWGWWDILVWNDVPDDPMNLHFDETLDDVKAYTNPTMRSARYNAPKYTRAFYTPEPLFSAYERGIDINRNLDGFDYDPINNVYVRRLNVVLEPLTYIYLTQVILIHNRGKVIGIDGSTNLAGMARMTSLTTGVTDMDAVTINYSTHMKKGMDTKKVIDHYGEAVDIIGGKVLTFGLCGMNANRISRPEDIKDEHEHFLDVNMVFNNGMDSTFVFNVTDQVRKRFKGGVLTVEIDMDTVAVPTRSGGSAFDAVVKDFEDGGTHEFEM